MQTAFVNQVVKGLVIRTVQQSTCIGEASTIGLGVNTPNDTADGGGGNDVGFRHDEGDVGMPRLNGHFTTDALALTDTLRYTIESSSQAGSSCNWDAIDGKCGIEELPLV